MAKQIKASDIFEEEDLFKGLRDSALKTIETFDKLSAEMKKSAEEMKKSISATTLSTTTEIENLIKVTGKASAMTEESIKIDKAKAEALKQYAQAEQQLEKIEQERQKTEQQKIRTAEMNKKAEQDEIKRSQQKQKTVQDEANAYKQLSIAARDMKNASKELGAQLLQMEQAGQQGTDAFTELQKQYADVTKEASRLDKELKQIDKAVGDNQRNVGNYESAVVNLKEELRNLTKELMNMDEADPKFQEMAQRAGELKDKIADTQAVVNATAGSGMENLAKGLTGVGQIGIAAFQGIESSMALMGVESEALMETMVRLQALAGLADALETLGGLGDKITEIGAAFKAAASKLGLLTIAKTKDVVATEAETVATVTQTAATNGATVATKALRIAMIALPIVAILAGVAALVMYFQDMSKNVSDTAIQMDALAGSAEDTRSALAGTIEQTSKMKTNFDMAREGVISKEQALYEYNETLGDTFGRATDLNTAEEIFNAKTANYVKAIGLRAQANYMYQLQAQELAKGMTAAMEDNSTWYENLGDAAAYQWYSLTGDMEGQMKTMTSAVGREAGKANEIKKEAERRAKLYEEMANNLMKEAMTLDKANGIKTESELAYEKAQAEKEKARKERQRKANEDAKREADRKAQEERKRLQDIAQFRNDILQQIEDMENEYYDTLLPAQTKETNAVRDKYFTLIEYAKQYGVDTTTLEAAREAEILAINKKYNDAIIKQEKDRMAQIAQEEEDFATQYREATQTEYQNQEDAIREKYFYLIETAKKYGWDIKKLEEKQAKELADLKKEKQQEELDKEKEHREAVAEVVNQSFEILKERSEKKIELIDKEIDAAQTQFDNLKELANQGNINAQQSLAEQQKIIAEANKKKAIEERRQQMLEMANTVFSTYQSKVEAGSKTPLADTIKDTALLMQFIKTLPTFHDGTENTGKHGEGVDGKGGFHAILHPNERVMPKNLNDQIGNISNEDLTRMAIEYNNGVLVRKGQANAVASPLEFSLMLNKLDQLNETIQNKPEHSYDVGKITSTMIEFVDKHKKGNTTVYNRYRVRK
jgi:hypothetical protein